MDWQIGLNFYSKRVVAFDLINIEKDFLKKLLQEWKCHIYILCKRKKIYFENLSVSDHGAQMLNLYTLDRKHDKIRFSKEVPDEVTVIGYENGFIKFDLDEEKNNLARDFIFYNFLFAIPDDPLGTSVIEEIPTDLEVIYVGQAFGRNADKTIDYRLVSHEKVQKIAVEILNKGSNEEILVLGIDVDANDITTGFSLSSSPTEFTKEKFYELMSNAKQRVPEGQKITIFEASLIKYFKPDLNKEYKETFPSQDFASYSEIYQTKFNYISFTIDCCPSNARLYSRLNPERKYIHHNVHSLATSEEKKSLFDYLMRTADKSIDNPSSDGGA